MIISGFPCAGKTYRTNQLVEYFNTKIADAAKAVAGAETNDAPPADSSTDNSTPPQPPLTPAQRRYNAMVSQLKVHVVSDAGLGIGTHVYGVVRDEKDARAAEMSAIMRHLGKSSIVIADGLNYIKGFRYQMYCEAKGTGTPSCVVSCHCHCYCDCYCCFLFFFFIWLTTQEIHVGTPAEVCRARNGARIESTDETDRKAAYDPEVFDNLVFRYEEPNGMTRWDSPLFTVVGDDPTPDCAGIWDAIVGADGAVKAMKPNMATVLVSTFTPWTNRLIVRRHQSNVRLFALSGNILD